MVRAIDVPVWAIISDARARAGFSRLELAAAARILECALADYERARTIPPAPILERIVRACERAIRSRLDPYGPDDAAELEQFRMSLTLEQRLTAARLLADLQAALHDPQPHGLY